MVHVCLMFTDQKCLHCRLSKIYKKKAAVKAYYKQNIACRLEKLYLNQNPWLCNSIYYTKAQKDPQ